MTQATWTTEHSLLLQPRTNRLKFVIGGVIIAAAIIFLVVNATTSNSQLYKTVDEFFAEQTRLTGRDLRVSGLVLGDSIQFTQLDATTSRLEFDIVDNIQSPGRALHVIAMNEPMPDLLQHEAQALIEGHADQDGNFYVNSGGLFLKCPTRYEELEPVESN